MARKGKGMQKKAHLADMSVPADERGRRRSTRTSRNPVPAQMQRGNSAHARSMRRDGERLMERERSEVPAVLEWPLEPEDPRL